MSTGVPNSPRPNLDAFRLPRKDLDGPLSLADADSGKVQFECELIRESGTLGHRELAAVAAAWSKAHLRTGQPVYVNGAGEIVAWLLDVFCTVKEGEVDPISRSGRYNCICGKIDMKREDFDRLIRSREYQFVIATLREEGDNLVIASVSLTNRPGSPRVGPIRLSDASRGGAVYGQYANQLAAFQPGSRRYFRELLTLLGAEKAQREECSESHARRLCLRDDRDLGLALSGGDDLLTLEAAARTMRRVDGNLSLRSSLTLGGVSCPGALQLYAVQLSR
jgi:hypothetical protein